jgi:hypothetical protein
MRVFILVFPLLESGEFRPRGAENHGGVEPTLNPDDGFTFIGGLNARDVGWNGSCER